MIKSVPWWQLVWKLLDVLCFEIKKKLLQIFFPKKTESAIEIFEKISFIETGDDDHEV